jgi:excisionase family DNA binding protein
LKLLRAEEVAIILDVSRSTARRMLIDGTLPAICLRSGKRKKVYRVRESELERFVISLERQRQSIKSKGDSKRLDKKMDEGAIEKSAEGGV